MTKIKNSQLISRSMPKNAIVTKRTNEMIKIERRWIAKKGFWAIVTTKGRNQTMVPFTRKDGSIDRREPKGRITPKGCEVCGCDFVNFSHDRCDNG